MTSAPVLKPGEALLRLLNEHNRLPSANRGIWKLAKLVDCCQVKLATSSKEII